MTDTVQYYESNKSDLDAQNFLEMSKYSKFSLILEVILKMSIFFGTIIFISTLAS